VVQQTGGLLGGTKAVKDRSRMFCGSVTAAGLLQIAPTVVSISDEGGYCNENSIYVFPEKELHGLSPNFHIHVPVGKFYILRIGPHIFLLQNR
jgi:hypothetical protein